MTPLYLNGVRNVWSKSKTDLSKPVDNFEITIDDIQKFLKEYKLYYASNERTTLRTLEDFYYSDKESEVKEIKEYLNQLNLALKHAVDLLKKNKIDSFDLNSLKKSLLTSNLENFYAKEKFPIVVYVSAKNDPNTVGLSLSYDGKFEMFEGNDESIPETDELINRLLNIGGELVKVYGMHGKELVDKIKRDGEIPVDVYVSPSRSYAGSYWDLKGDRELFSVKIPKNCIRQESDVDWKIIKPAKISNLIVF